MSSRLSRRARLAVIPLDDRAVPAAHALYAVTQDWGSGFQGQVQLTNDGPAAVAFNTLQFTLPSNITSIYDAKVMSHVGNSYTVTNAGYDASIPAGGSVTFGFVAARGTSAVATGFVLGGVALDNPSPPSPPPPVSPPAALRATYKTASDWGSGETGDLTLKNTGTTAVSGWRVSFDFPGQISSLWNGTVVSHVGNRYTVKSAGWNDGIPAGGSVDVGFSASPGGLSATNITVTFVGDPPVNHAPAAANDAVTAAGAVTVNVLANDTDADGDKLTVTGVGKAAHGTAAVNADNTVTYVPVAGFAGTDSFTYTIADGHGGTATGTVTVRVTAPVPPPAAPTWPAQVNAPYVDATAWPTFDFVAAAKATGDKYFTLAFVVADPSGKPAWGGYPSLGVTGSDFAAQLQTQIAALRALGGDVAVSFGGASGLELAQVITNPQALAAAYQQVIDTYGLTHIDFDVEGAAVADAASIDRRNQAIAILEANAAAAGKELNVRYTLPVLPTGLDGNGLSVLQSAKANGARVDVVNVMAMDYGDGAAPNPAGHMGDYAIQAATSLFGQLGTLYGASLTDAQRWAMIGVTPMIGLNDITTETFTQADARELEAWAASHHIGLLSMWSLNRDRQNPAGAIGTVDTNSSSLTQTPYEFDLIFNAFVG